MNSLSMKIVLGGIVLPLFMVGCSSNSKQLQTSKSVTKVSKKQQKIDTSKNKLAKSSTLPKWVDNPDLDGNVGVVAIVKKGNKSKKKIIYIAKMKAQASLQARKSTMVDSKTIIKKQRRGNSYKRDVQKEVKLTSNSFATDNLTIKDTYEDKNNFYLWMVIKK